MSELLRFDPIGSHVDGADISSATALSPEDGATKLLIQALGQNVRLRLDGTTPTASKGFQLAAGDPPVMLWVAGATVKVIKEAATADIQYQWGR
ncbi:MAG: hypothetical protein PVI99_02290 [Anaerolineales bacterium]|jgi:hypothetical protein